MFHHHPEFFLLQGGHIRLQILVEGRIDQLGEAQDWGILGGKPECDMKENWGGRDRSIQLQVLESHDSPTAGPDPCNWLIVPQTVSPTG